MRPDVLGEVVMDALKLEDDGGRCCVVGSPDYRHGLDSSGRPCDASPARGGSRGGGREARPYRGTGGENGRPGWARRYAAVAARRAHGLLATLTVLGCENRSGDAACASDAPTPNLDRINAAIERLDEDTASMLARVHNLESELQGEAIHAAVTFIGEDGWALAVVSETGQSVHEWGILSEDCARACVDGRASSSMAVACRGVPVGGTSYVLCGSRDPMTQATSQR